MIEKWKHCKIGDVLELQRGYDVTKKDQRDGSIPVYSSGGLSSYHDTAMVDGPGVIIGRKGTLGRVFYSEGSYWPHDTTLWVRDFKGSSPRYVYYFLQTLDFEYMNVGSANPTLNRNHVHPLPVRWPPLAVQRAIGETLRALDGKIAANYRLADSSSRLAAACVDGACARSSERGVLGDVARFRNRERVPLSKNERAERDGVVPYYGATGVVDFVDHPLFDEPLVLVGEDGTVATDSGKPVVQFVWGPSWVNNHAHVLTGVGVSNPVLRYILGRSNVADRVTGAVQLKLSMGNLRLVAVDIPSPDELLTLERRVETLTSREMAAIDENKRLVATRDELLPLLMSGKITVKDAEKTVEEVV